MQDYCKYCEAAIVDLTDEGMACQECSKFVHLRCLKRGSTPGALLGDVFFEFTCAECSSDGCEIFSRENQRWLQVIILSLYSQSKQQQDAFSRKGLYQWRTHIAGFIERHWKVLFAPSVSQKKNWLGSISGQLSVYSQSFFRRSGVQKKTSGWWALTFPNLTPNVQIKLANELNAKKTANKSQGISCSDIEIIDEILATKNYPAEYVTRSTVTFTDSDLQSIATEQVPQMNRKRKLIKSTMPDLKKRALSFDVFTQESKSDEITISTSEVVSPSKFLDPMCHYNTSLNRTQMLSRINLKAKLMGDVRVEPLLSPYSNLYLKPFIRRDSSRTLPDWLKIMAELQLKVNSNGKPYKLPPRAPIDYVYVQPAHIPAVNSLCNQFFWPGIDLTDCLQYPDFTCVAIYKKLIIGFAVLVPNVKVHENYISFLFVRPGWRNVGIGKFMLYHLIQTSMGKDITLHVAMNNPALLLYQKFGFKVEHVEVNFYDKYLQSDAFESKHAFFCRLER